MSLFGDMGWLPDLWSRPKRCKDCKEQRDMEVDMEATEAWHPRLCGYVDVWRCPECGRELMRGDIDGDVPVANFDPEEMNVRTSRAPSGWWRD